ncbi:MAG: hypothetical protein HRU07_01250 [Nitrosopumilus sp.]|nr:hypothetical protein [Nitrosopumilus sp.]NRA04800.1 hypothetical protein [Nitrosopumilus sp.]
MGTQNNMIIIGAIGLALVVALFLIFRNFDLSKIGEDLQKGVDKFVEDTQKGIDSFVEDTQKGFDEFFNGTEEQQLSKETQDIFQRQIEEKEQQAKDAGFGSVESFERATDTNKDPTKFNPDGIIGYGYRNVNGGRGIPDTQENRDILDDLISGKATFNSESSGEISKDAENNFARLKPRLKNRTTTVRGTAKSKLDTNQTFEVFGTNEGNRKVTGVIRETPKDPRKLRTNSNNRPTETASQRANRVFIEQGKFVDEDRGLGVTSAKEKTKSFKFGTNTGRGLSIPTKGLTTRQRMQQRKKLAEEKAKKIFDSGSINNL